MPPMGDPPCRRTENHATRSLRNRPTRETRGRRASRVVWRDELCLTALAFDPEPFVGLEVVVPVTSGAEILVTSLAVVGEVDVAVIPLESLGAVAAHHVADPVPLDQRLAQRRGDVAVPADDLVHVD